MGQEKQEPGKKYVVLLLIFAILIALSGAYVIEGTRAYTRYQQSVLANQEHCGGQPPVHVCVQAPASIFSSFYPSYQGAEYPLFGVNYISSRPLTLVITVSIPHFTQPQERIVSAGAVNQTSYFIPPLLGKALKDVTSEEHTSLRVEVSDTNHHQYYVDDTPLVLHSRWLMQWVGANRLKIAAWVTPEDPAIAALVNKAATHLAQQQPPAPTSMQGYRGASKRQVIDQVDAIYDALREDYHIHYVQASVPYSGSGDTSEAIENVKLPSDVLQQRSGMCVELTTLLASAVEHIGLHSQIVITPGHAFLGVAVTEDNKNIEYWDAAEVDKNIAGDSANIQADTYYRQNLKQHTILDTIVVSDARDAHVGPML